MTDHRTTPHHTNDSPIARLRMERGITQGQLAQMAGCLAKDISRWETGARGLSTRSAMKLARALGCSIEDLLNDE